MKNKKERVRKKLLLVYVTDEEYDFIKLKMSKVSIKNFSAYARKMLIDGRIIKIEAPEQLQSLIYEINKVLT